ncbi:pyridoxamine 5'-phosphate oxidase family protein [Treponema sp.]|uniref:pyridoxamine 5'-phosphate oxidase family protein n=1 Tax=Treponema sp. TaxID=166 RepID=UPI00388ED350
MSAIETLHAFLKDAETYYLATTDGDQPRVRPFGTATLFEGRIYILTAKSKDVSKQIAANSKFEISAMDKQGRWIRVSGVLTADNRKEVHEALLADYPHLGSMYTAGDDNTNALYLDQIKATICSFTAAPEELQF